MKNIEFSLVAKKKKIKIKIKNGEFQNWKVAEL